MKSLIRHLEKQHPGKSPAKGDLPSAPKSFSFCTFTLKGTRLCLSDSWCTIEGVVVKLPPGRYDITAACVTYGNKAFISSVRIAPPGITASRGRKAGEVGIDVGSLGITDRDKIKSLTDEEYGQWSEEHSQWRDHPPAGIQPCEQADTTMPFIAAGFGDGVYPVYRLLQKGKTIGVEVCMITSGEPYPMEGPEYYQKLYNVGGGGA